jgi:CubicO group peptidase (beta-lactamase class C family)
VRFTSQDLNDVDKIFSDYFNQGRSPGLVYGITDGSKLVHTKALGFKSIDGDLVEIDTSFRVASLTKSFTAAAVLVLRDRGLLSLEIPAKTYVPELAEIKSPFPDSPELTIHHFLCMSSGLPTDNEWADRLEDISDNQLKKIILNAPRFNFNPGTNYEYSNLGYAIVALAIRNVTGKDFINFVEDEILIPLGLDSTTFEYSDASNFALGYVMRDSWDLETLTGPGAFSAIGGVTTNISDLTKWSHYLASAFNPECLDEGPISKSSRRQMQQVQQVITQIREPNVELTYEGINGYGYGLRIEEDLDFGKFVGHSGGYPGYGAHMRWHPDSGLGVIALANGRYASPVLACIPSIRLLLSKIKKELNTPMPVLLYIQNKVNSLINNWNDMVANEIFGTNMDQDHPRSFRISQIDTAKKLVEYVAENTKVINIKSINNSHISWQLSGNSGFLEVSVYLNPDTPENIQTLTVLPVSLFNS